MTRVSFRSAGHSGRQFIDPVSFAIVMEVQPDLIVPGYQQIFRIFRGLLDGLARKIDEHFRLAPPNSLDPLR